MKILACLFLSIFLAGCAQRSIELTSIRGRPIILEVEILATAPPKTKGDSRVEVSARILKGKEEGSKLLIVLSEALYPSEPFLVPGSRWRIHADEEIFEHQRAVGLSFWSLSDLNPEPISKQSGQSSQPN